MSALGPAGGTEPLLVQSPKLGQHSAPKLSPSGRRIANPLLTDAVQLLKATSLVGFLKAKGEDAVQARAQSVLQLVA